MSTALTSTGVTFPDATTQTTNASFDAATRLGFQQTTAPTGWTKDTTAAINDSALRFVTGSVVNGGSVAFTTAFASQAVSGTNGASAAYTLATADIPSHTHSIPQYGNAQTKSPPFLGVISNAGIATSTTATGATGSGGSHSHGAASFTGTAINLAVKYYDFIIASKN